MNSKSLLIILITAIVVGGGVYFWQNYDLVSKDDVKEMISEELATEKAPKIPDAKEVNLKTFDSDTLLTKVSFQYPETFTAWPTGDPIRAKAGRGVYTITVEKEGVGRIEIFRFKDFPGHDRPWGFTGEETQEDIDGYLPKEDFLITSENELLPTTNFEEIEKKDPENTHFVWLFYGLNDLSAKNELHNIINTLKIE